MENEKNKTINRIVIKIGTSSLTHITGKLNYRRLEEIVSVVCDLKNIGYEIAMVSSGAIGVGLGKAGLMKKPEETAKRRALAAIGQSSLMAVYEELFGAFGCQVAQVLLTKSAFMDKTDCDVIADSFATMFEYGVLPVVNENDTAAKGETGSNDLIGDNDTLSAYVARFIEADLLILLSDVDGLYDKDPRIYKDAKIVPVVDELNESIYGMAGEAGTSRGRGGMLTKLNAAEIAMNAGIDMVITNSDKPFGLYEIVRGNEIGTLFKG